MDSGGVVKNLAVSGVVKSEVTANSSTWSYTGGVAGYNKGTLETCSFSGSVSAVLVLNSAMDICYAGGVVGCNNGSITNCYHTGTVTSSGNSQSIAGGVAGGNNNGGAVNNCYHTGDVTASGGGSNRAGGVVGASFSSSMTNCYFLQEEGSSLSGGSAAGKDAEAFASGEVAWLLQNEQEDAIWVQALGEDNTWYPALLALLSDSDTYYTVRRAAFTAGEDTTYEYTNSEGKVTAPDLPDGYVGWYLDDAKVEDSTIAVEDSDITVLAKTQQSTPEVSVNYVQENLSTTEDMEYSTDGTTWADCSADMAVSAFDWTGSEITVYFRTKATDTSFASDEQKLIIPARPAAPTDLQGVNETVDGNHDGKITGVTAAMEYKLSTDTQWTACGGTEVTDLAPDSYQVRLAATESSFASAAADVKIAIGAAPTYTLNVTVPAFAAETYGTRPDAEAITISNSGNSASTVSDVALSGDTGAFVLSKPEDAVTVQPGQSDTSYTIRPAAGLSAGTYTDTITVTYQGDGTVETTVSLVSFTVTPASQEAPAAAPALASRSNTSITLQEIAANDNDVAAEYGISADGGETWTWQDSPVFTDLSSGTTYTFAVRYRATENYVASPASETAEFSTARPSYPTNPTYPPAVEEGENGSASVSPKNPSQGDKVTITPDPDKGYEVGSITVTDQNGRPVKITDNGDGTYSFIQPAGRVTVEVTFTEIQKLPFTDVPADAYYYDAVVWAVRSGVTTGDTATTFSPDAPCTRAQAVTFLWRAAGSPEPVSAFNPFADVRPGDYYYTAVLWAVENGITVGTTATTFSPDQACTRAQIMTFLYRAVGTASAGSNPFTDVQPGAYYYDAVVWAVKYGVTTGTGAATFGPDAACTRAQIVTFLYRVYG